MSLCLSCLIPAHIGLGVSSYQITSRFSSLMILSATSFVRYSLIHDIYANNFLATFYQ
ncbi:hypothetical protein UPTC16703_0893 [Campylobacter lari]|nr:hypothetical protein [Campylobacter lari]MCR6528538.1 hypothetical protein [Campylobacter lari]MCR6542290.1 hypothetical protein [Campylobacter lari]MCR6557964.1 hypothetical protein [Campylobacter lari]